MAAIQFSDALRNAPLDAYELTIGTSPNTVPHPTS
jgi:hypothetical protein